jgi:hypothetical protein
VVGRFFELLEKMMGWFRFSKYFQMKEPPIPILWGKKKRNRKGTSRIQLVVFKNLKEPAGLHE